MDPASPSPLARLRALPPRVLDTLIALAVGVEACAEVLLWSPLTGGDLALGLAIVTMMAVGCGLRRASPFAAITLSLGGLLLGDMLVPEFLDHTAGPFFSVLLVSYTAGARLEGRRLAGGFALATALMLTMTIAGAEADPSVPNLIFSTTFAVAAPMAFGQLMVNRSRLNRALQEKAARAEAEREGRAQSAALEERTRIAGELHDVVAHALSAMTVQASGARRLAQRDPDRAREAFATVEHTGREALTEMRRLLGVLRKGDEELALAPQPSLAHVDSLARRAQASGLPVALIVTGDVRPLPAGVDLTAYRLVQEALTGARDVGRAGRAEVHIFYGADHVDVDVSDDGRPRGRRLLGMRERVAIYGGELATEPAEGGWRVSARLPAEAAA
jgi:signal transduction histidine kinase